MKSIISIFIALILVKGNLGFSLIPQLQDETITDTVSTNYMDDPINITLTQFPTTLHGLSTLKNELSYNCLSQNFDFSIQAPPNSGSSGRYLFNGLVNLFGVYAEINDIIGDILFDCPTATGQDGCLIRTLGKIIERQSDDGGEDSRISFVNSSLYTSDSIKLTSTIENGTLDGVSIIGHPYHDLVVYVVGVFMDSMPSENAAALLNDYLNYLVTNTSLPDLITMTGGNCKADLSDRVSIIPELPETLTFEPEIFSMNQYNRNQSLKYDRVITGLNSLESELSYNCISGRFELVTVIDNLSIGGLFEIQGSYGINDDFDVVSATGSMQEICPSSAVTEDGKCMLGVHGLIRQNGSENGIGVENLNFAQVLEFQFLVLDGIVNGEPVDETTDDVIYREIVHFKYDIGVSLHVIVENYLNQILANTTMVDLIRMTGGECDV